MLCFISAQINQCHASLETERAHCLKLAHFFGSLFAKYAGETRRQCWWLMTVYYCSLELLHEQLYINAFVQMGYRFGSQSID